jgi:hypothetical protein
MKNSVWFRLAVDAPSTLLPSCMRDGDSCTALFFLARAESGVLLSARLDVAKMCEYGLETSCSYVHVVVLKSFVQPAGILRHLVHPSAAPIRRRTFITVMAHSAHRYVETSQTCLTCAAKVAFLSEFNHSMSVKGQLS